MTERPQLVILQHSLPRLLTKHIWESLSRLKRSSSSSSRLLPLFPPSSNTMQPLSLQLPFFVGCWLNSTLYSDCISYRDLKQETSAYILVKLPLLFHPILLRRALTPSLLMLRVLTHTATPAPLLFRPFERERGC